MADHSFRDYSHGTQTGHPGGAPLAALDPAEFTGTTIKGTCFACEVPDTQVFPPGTANVAFVCCNLDNVALPPGSTTEECSVRRHAVQPDGRLWLVDEHGTPTVPADGILAIAEDGGTIDHTGHWTPAGTPPNVDLPVGVDVGIAPQVLPYVQATVAAGTGFTQAAGAVFPHLDGAFESVKANWANLTPAQQTELLARSPNLKAAMSFMPDLMPLVSKVPDVLTGGQ